MDLINNKELFVYMQALLVERFTDNNKIHMKKNLKKKKKNQTTLMIQYILMHMTKNLAKTALVEHILTHFLRLMHMMTKNLIKEQAALITIILKLPTMTIERIVVEDMLVEQLLTATIGWLMKYANGFVILKSLAGLEARHLLVQHNVFEIAETFTQGTLSQPFSPFVTIHQMMIAFTHKHVDATAVFSSNSHNNLQTHQMILDGRCTPLVTLLHL